MKLKVIIHEAEEGGLWAEVPAIPGCMTQGESIKQLIENLYDAVEGCLSIDMAQIPHAKSDTVMELAVWHEDCKWQVSRKKNSKASRSFGLDGLFLPHHKTNCISVAQRSLFLTYRSRIPGESILSHDAKDS
jgi:predicted RNase H-like HicB family nuclease